MRFTGEEKGSLVREQSPVAIYSLTPGADAFTMRETRDGSLRKTVVWTLADGVWTMEVFDETVAPRELVGTGRDWYAEQNSAELNGGRKPLL